MGCEDRQVVGFGWAGGSAGVAGGVARRCAWEVKTKRNEATEDGNEARTKPLRNAVPMQKGGFCPAG
jgi:hypothetical protein